MARPNKEDIQQTIDISNEFFTINDIKINGDKSELIVLNSSQTTNNNCITMGDQNTIVYAKTNLAETRFLSIYLRKKKGNDHIIRCMKEIISEFSKQLANKKM